MLVLGSCFPELCSRNELLQTIHELFELSVAGKKLINLYAKVCTLSAGLSVRQHIIIVLHVMSPRADHNIAFAPAQR